MAASEACRLALTLGVSGDAALTAPGAYHSGTSTWTILLQLYSKITVNLKMTVAATGMHSFCGPNKNPDNALNQRILQRSALPTQLLQQLCLTPTMYMNNLPLSAHHSPVFMRRYYALLRHAFPGRFDALDMMQRCIFEGLSDTMLVALVCKKLAPSRLTCQALSNSIDREENRP